jgi:uncharacterized protein YyaL (SSP411 family)
MPNHLAQETSPYLLQHADNPVDWHPWGVQALELAKAQNKPILLSVGYSACHWCHVMAHESFEDARTADLMNRYFINIKVDREERPDIDQIYQTAHAMMTQRSGGWPLTMFLTPQQVPFFGGTYFPPTPRYNLPGFAELLTRVAQAFHERGADIEQQTRPLLDALSHKSDLDTPQKLSPSLIDAGIAHLKAAFDPHHGGFGDSPKFPNAPDWVLLLRSASNDDAARSMAVKTLQGMAAGGIYDHLAGGFCRYSVDERWEIPHFEKMLYDNGQLLSLYTDGWLLTGEPRWQEVVEECIDWLQSELNDPEGAFYAALDADSEGVEGKFYVWDRSEVQILLPPDMFPAFADYYGLNTAPNFEGKHWHLCIKGIDGDAADLARARKLLLSARSQRVRPGLDDKILTSWNALAIKGLAQAAKAFNRPDWLKTAQTAMDFVRGNLWKNDRLYATYKYGGARFNGYLDDHAFLLDALLALLQAEYRQQDLDFAVLLADTLLQRFEDTEGGFFFTSHDHEHLIQRPKSPYDNAIPSGNGIAASALQRLGHLLGETRYLKAAERTLLTFSGALGRNPASCPSLLCALQEWLSPPTLVVLRGEQTQAWQQHLAARFLPHCLIVALPNHITTGISTLDKPASQSVNAWVCKGVECLPAINSLDELMMRLGALN